MQMKTKTKIVTGIISIILSCVLFFTVAAINPNTNQVAGASTRTVRLAQTAVDAQSLLNEFDDAKLTQSGTTTYFEGYKALEAEKLSEIDYISEDNFEEIENCKVRYNFSYDTESNVVTVAASTTLADGSIEIDEIHGVGFINDNGEIDAVMNVDGEGVLLSEMRSAGLIENCGWFSRLIKKVVKAVVVVAAVAAVVVASAAVMVATAGVAAPALVAVGVGTTAAYGVGAAVGIVAGAIFYSSMINAAIQAGTAVGEFIGNGLEVIIDKASEAIMAFCFDNIEYLMQKATLQNIAEYQESGKIYLSAIGNNSNTYISSISVSKTVAVWFMRVTKYTNYVSYIGTGIYTWDEDDAYSIAMDASEPGKSPKYDAPHGKSTSTKLYFEHWHDSDHRGHAFYGQPV